MTSETKAQIIADLNRRLRPLCADWPQEEFDAMVAQFADITIKYQGLLGIQGYDRRSSERLLEEMKTSLARSEALKRSSNSQ
jgi:hypothetical protein